MRQKLYCKEQSKLIHIARGKVKNSVVSFLRENKLILERDQYLCQLCIKVASAKIELPTKEDQEQSQPTKRSRYCYSKDPIVVLKNFTEFLEEYVGNAGVNEKSFDSYLSKIFFLLAKFLKPRLITDDGDHLSKAFKNYDYLRNLDLKDFIMGRDVLLISFLQGLCGRDFSVMEQSCQLFQIVIVIEQIFHLINFHWVLPHSFVTNMIQSCISGSKTVTALNGKLTAGGGYTTYLNWMKENGSVPLTCPDGDQVIYFDNIGRYINKNYRVSKEKIKSADIISTTIHICLNNGGDSDDRGDDKPLTRS